MKSTPSKLEQELLRVTKVKPKADRQKTLMAIAEKINAMDQKEYNKLSSKAQDWYEEAVAAAAAGDDFPNPSAKLRLTPVKKKAKLKLKKEPKVKETPTYRKVMGMKEDELEDLVNEFEVDFGNRDFDDFEEIQRFVAKELGLKGPKKKKGKKLPVKARPEEELSWGKVQHMSEKALTDLVNDENVKFPKSFEPESLKEIKDFVCKKLGLRPPRHAVMKMAAQKKPKAPEKPKQPTKKEKEALKKKERLEKGLRKLGFNGQRLAKLMVYVERQL